MMIKIIGKSLKLMLVRK